MMICNDLKISDLHQRTCYLACGSVLFPWTHVLIASGYVQGCSTGLFWDSCWMHSDCLYILPCGNGRSTGGHQPILSLYLYYRLKVGEEGDDRGWYDSMASPTKWTWVWVNSRSWWWTGRPGVLQSMGSQRVGHDWVTELNCITVSDIPLKKCFTGPNLRLRNCCSEKEKQRMSFSFLFLRTKKIKRTGAGLNIPSFLLQLLLTLPVCN